MLSGSLLHTGDSRGPCRLSCRAQGKLHVQGNPYRYAEHLFQIQCFDEALNLVWDEGCHSEAVHFAIAINYYEPRVGDAQSNFAGKVERFVKQYFQHTDAHVALESVFLSPIPKATTSLASVLRTIHMGNHVTWL